MFHKVTLERVVVLDMFRLIKLLATNYRRKIMEGTKIGQLSSDACNYYCKLIYEGNINNSTTNFNVFVTQSS